MLLGSLSVSVCSLVGVGLVLVVLVLVVGFEILWVGV